MRVIDGPEKPFDGERAAGTVAGYNLYVSNVIEGVGIRKIFFCYKVFKKEDMVLPTGNTTSRA